MMVDGRPLHIAIDGLVATGKTTVGMEVARRLGILFLDTGVIYRSITLKALECQADIGNEEQCGLVAERLDLLIMPPTSKDGRPSTVILGGIDVTWQIRTSDIDRCVPTVAAHPRVRRAVRQIQHEIAMNQPIVMVGRDIASVVLPDAQIKIMLTASPEERVRRRLEELQSRHHDLPIDAAQLHMEIRQRDDEDLFRLNTTLHTIMINTDGLSKSQVVDKLMAIIEFMADPCNATAKRPTALKQSH